MNYRSIEDMNRIIKNNLFLIPRDIELVVGIPRSGMLPASMITLYMNLPMATITEFLSGEITRNVLSSRQEGEDRKVSSFKKILVIDDSCNTGGSMQKAKELLDPFEKNCQILYATVFATDASKQYVDIYFDLCDWPRVFEWNVMNHFILAVSCVDMDGVLCKDPTEEQNDDGPNYLEFIKNAEPLFIPKHTIGAIVTSRLEKYRKATEDWLADHGVRYGTLIMLNLPDKETRIKLGAHSIFKSQIYGNTNARLFIESNPKQAAEINSLTNKPVYCVENGLFYNTDNSFKEYEISKSRVDEFFQRVDPILETFYDLQEYVNSCNDDEISAEVYESGIIGLEAIKSNLEMYVRDKNLHTDVMNNLKDKMFLNGFIFELEKYIYTTMDSYIRSKSSRVTEDAWEQEINKNINDIVNYIKQYGIQGEFEAEWKYIIDNGIQMYPYEFVKKYNEDEVVVYRDDIKKLKYVLHKGKKLYFPNRSDASIKHEYNQLIMEQDEMSPHHYFSPNCNVDLDTIFVDVGAAEGIISLELVEKVKEIYLIECNQEWIEALKCTFADYMNKVHIIPKYAGRFDNENTISIDTLLSEIENEKLFIKMDVEGMELDVLQGALKTLYYNECSLSCATYHTEDAIVDLTNLFEAVGGYSSEPSDRWMLFYYGNLVMKNGKYNHIKAPFFRRALIRAWKDVNE